MSRLGQALVRGRCLTSSFDSCYYHSPALGPLVFLGENLGTPLGACQGDCGKFHSMRMRRECTLYHRPGSYGTNLAFSFTSRLGHGLCQWTSMLQEKRCLFHRVGPGLFVGRWCFRWKRLLLVSYSLFGWFEGCPLMVYFDF